MILDSFFENEMRAAGQSQRIDVQRVLTGLRHLKGSVEPGRVFAEVVAVCVPSLCDEMIVDIEETGTQRYRITRSGIQINRAATDLPQQSGALGLPTVSGQSVTVRVTSLPGGGPGFTVWLSCWWDRGYSPTDTDAALVGLTAHHATAVVHRERTIGTIVDSATAYRPEAATGGGNESRRPAES